MKHELNLADALSVVAFLRDDLNGGEFGVSGVEEIHAGRGEMAVLEGQSVRAGRQGVRNCDEFELDDS